VSELSGQHGNVPLRRSRSSLSESQVDDIDLEELNCIDGAKLEAKPSRPIYRCVQSASGGCRIFS